VPTPPSTTRWPWSTRSCSLLLTVFTALDFLVIPYRQGGRSTAARRGWAPWPAGRKGAREGKERRIGARGDGGRRRGSRGGRREAAAGSKVGRERAAGRRKCGT